jgi:hypothetical protein
MLDELRRISLLVNDRTPKQRPKTANESGPYA